MNNFTSVLIAAVGVMALSASAASAHDCDGDEHHYFDHERAHELTRHAAEDRRHASEAFRRASATGDPRDYLHALQDNEHARRAAREARKAQERAHDHPDHWDRD